MSELVAELPAWLIATDGAELLMRLTLRWSPDEPWTVAVSFPTGAATEVVWLIGRDLLYEGLTGHAGLGDVRLFPSAHWGRTALHLSAPSGHAQFGLVEGELREFLLDTFDAVPEGEELLWFPLEEHLTALLDGSEL